MSFDILQQTTDNEGSPVFGYMVKIEGVEGGTGKGYSKKEAQQAASQETLLRLRREPQFIDAIFSAKSDRTKMEEEPTAIAPELEQENDFIIKKDISPEVPSSEVPVTDEFDLSDITHNPSELSREEIIAAAESAAYNE